MKHIYLIRPKEDWGGIFKSSMTYQQAKAYAMVMARKEGKPYLVQKVEIVDTKVIKGESL